MDPTVFWSTFWGGLGSILVAGIITGAVAWVWAKMSKRMQGKDAWTLAVDDLGRTTVTYNLRKAAIEPHVDLFRVVDGVRNPVEGANVFPMPRFTKGMSFPIDKEPAWDELLLTWRESEPVYADAIRPPAGKSVGLRSLEVKPKLIHRLGNFLLTK